MLVDQALVLTCRTVWGLIMVNFDSNQPRFPRTSLYKVQCVVLPQLGGLIREPGDVETRLSGLILLCPKIFSSTLVCFVSYEDEQGLPQTGDHQLLRVP